MKNLMKFFLVLFTFVFFPVAACKSAPPADEADADVTSFDEANADVPLFDAHDDASADIPSFEEANADIPSFDDVKDKDWVLTEIRAGSETIVIDRERLASNGVGDAFTLRFDDDLVRGKGAPNTYRGPYTPADNQAVTFGVLASTMMAAIFEPEELKEHQFFAYLQSVSCWNIAGEKLELHSAGDDGTEAVLVFALAE